MKEQLGPEKVVFKQIFKYKQIVIIRKFFLQTREAF